MTDVRYYLLCRHGPHRSGVLVKKGEGEAAEFPTVAVGNRLRDVIRDSAGSEEIVIRAVLCARSPEAVETTRVPRTAV
ncbi:hypothetical protein GCM10027612_87440 [Microbispora bryophytorum subsp. camponoti]